MTARIYTRLITDNEPRYIVTMFSRKLGNYTDERVYDYETLIQYVMEWQFDDLHRIYCFDADTGINQNVSHEVARIVMDRHHDKGDEPCNEAQNWMSRFDIYWD